MNTLPLQVLLMTLAGWVNRSQQDVIEYLQEENRVLREHPGGRRLHFTDAPRRRWRPRPGRSTARRFPESGRWSHPTPWFVVGRNTIKRIRSAKGIQPATIRRKGMSWEAFLKSPWGVIAATDFFNVRVLTSAGLIRYFVLFVIDLKTRRVKIAGVIPRPDGRWMKQVAPGLTDAYDGSLAGSRYLIHDRDPLFTEEFRGILKAGGVRTVKLPAQNAVSAPGAASPPAGNPAAR